MISRTKVAMLLFSLLAFGPAAMSQTQTPVENDPRFASPPKNLKVLRVSKPQDLRTIMEHFNDSLGVGIEIMTRFQVRRNQKNKLGVGVVGTGTIVCMPDRIAEPSASRADVRVAGRVPEVEEGVRHHLAG